MSRVIPNEESWIGFLDGDVPNNLCSPTVAEISACIDLTCLVSSLNATAQGNTVPTPSLCTLFETSVPGTSQATFQGEFYRDKISPATDPDYDLAWYTLTRKATGTFIVGRFGIPKNATTHVPTPIVGSRVECWPVEITSRAAGPMASGTPLSFTMTAAVNIEPCEDATVVT